MRSEGGPTAGARRRRRRVPPGARGSEPLASTPCSVLHAAFRRAPRHGIGIVGGFLRPCIGIEVRADARADLGQGVAAETG